MTKAVDRNKTQDSSTSIPEQTPQSVPARNLRYISNQKLERELNCQRLLEAILCGFCAVRFIYVRN